MGNCVSARDCKAQQRSQEIDKQIEEDSRRFKKECKILLLGALSLSLRCYFSRVVLFRASLCSFCGVFSPSPLPPSHTSTPPPFCPLL